MLKNRWVRVALTALVMVVLLYFSFKSVNWKDAWGYMTRANPVLFLLVVLLSPLHLVTRGFRWRYLLIHEKKDVKFANLFAGNAVGFAVTFIFPGRVGEIVKPLWVARKEKIRAGFALGTVIVERIFDMFTMCFLLAVFLLARPLYETTFKVQADAYTKLTNWGIVGAVIATGLLTVCLLFYFFREKAIRMTMFFLKPFPSKWSEKVRTLLHEFIDGLKFFHSLGNLATYIILSIVVWLGITFFYWVFFQAYRVKIPYFLLIPYIFLTMVGASIPTPGMVAGFEAFSILGLSLLYPGIFPKGDTSLAAGLTIVVHAVQLIVTCLIGYAIVWKQGLSLFQLKKLEEPVEP